MQNRQFILNGLIFPTLMNCIMMQPALLMRLIPDVHMCFAAQFYWEKNCFKFLQYDYLNYKLVRTEISLLMWHFPFILGHYLLIKVSAK